MATQKERALAALADGPKTSGEAAAKAGLSTSVTIRALTTATEEGQAVRVGEDPIVWALADAKPQSQQAITIEVMMMMREEWALSTRIRQEILGMGYDWKPDSAGHVPMNALWKKGYVVRRQAEGVKGNVFEYKLADECQRKTLPPLNGKGGRKRRRKASAPAPTQPPPAPTSVWQRIKSAWIAIRDAA